MHPATYRITRTVLEPPAIKEYPPVTSSVTLSTELPSGVPTPPLPALAYVTFKPSGTMNVPWLPQFNLAFPAGAIPPGSHIVGLYYRLGQGTTTQSPRQLARARAHEWLDSREVIA